ncbi:filamentous hemagglutinin [Bartonella sp. AC535YNZD]|uniref:filamentous hemagglutinin n=1 Tax=Bartonella sp. AC535YNZD TaxID=3243455 RepID=UPI0035D05C01
MVKIIYNKAGEGSITGDAHAKASSHGFSISGNDTIKNIAKNVLNHGKAKDAAEGETKSAISDGTIILTDTTGQRAMGQDAGQIIGSLNRNTAAAHQAVGQLDVAPLEGAVHNRVGMINDLSDEGLGYLDKIYKITNVKEHPVGEVAHDENGNVLYLTDENGEPIKDSDGEYITLYHFLNAEDEQYLQAGSDGNRRMFYNGIFNTPDEAAGNAVHLADNEHEPLYFTYFPQADDVLVELGVAFYQKFFEGGSWGLTNSTKKFQDFIYRYGNDNAIVGGHSRGSLTVGNGMRDFEQRGIHGIAEKTDIYLFGPADNSQSIANALYYVSDGKKDHIYLQNHIFDPIGTGIGHNLPTFYKAPLRFPYAIFPPATPMIEQMRALRGFKSSTHRCYGNAGDACERDYGTHHNDNTKIYAPHAILDNLGLGYLWRKK